MREGLFEIRDNTEIAHGVHRLVLTGEPDETVCPGQFVEIRIPGSFLRRPFSVCDHSACSVTVVYKEAGKGTAALAEMPAGTELSVLTGLGRGFDLDASGDRPLLVGGGTGASPMYGLAKALAADGKHVTAVLGFSTGEDAFLTESFAALGCEVRVTTVDGFRGTKGFVTDALPEGCTYLYACGPIPMLRALDRAIALPGEYSLEKRMGCGFGACMGCTIRTTDGQKRVCRDGPVFGRETILWED